MLIWLPFGRSQLRIRWRRLLSSSLARRLSQRVTASMGDAAMWALHILDERGELMFDGVYETAAKAGQFVEDTFELFREEGWAPLPA